MPLRLELGPRDVAADTVDAGAAHRRQEGSRCRWTGLPPRLQADMEQMQHDLLEAARARREADSSAAPPRQQFIDGHGGRRRLRVRRLVRRRRCEAEIKEQTKATIRVLPDEEFRSPEAPTTCMWCGRPSMAEVVWAKAY